MRDLSNHFLLVLLFAGISLWARTQGAVLLLVFVAVAIVGALLGSLLYLSALVLLKGGIYVSPWENTCRALFAKLDLPAFVARGVVGALVSGACYWGVASFAFNITLVEAPSLWSFEAYDTDGKYLKDMPNLLQIWVELGAIGNVCVRSSWLMIEGRALHRFLTSFTVTIFLPILWCTVWMIVESLFDDGSLGYANSLAFPTLIIVYVFPACAAAAILSHLTFVIVPLPNESKRMKQYAYGVCVLGIIAMTALGCLRSNGRSRSGFAGEGQIPAVAVPSKIVSVSARLFSSSQQKYNSLFRDGIVVTSEAFEKSKCETQPGLTFR